MEETAGTVGNRSCLYLFCLYGKEVEIVEGLKIELKKFIERKSFTEKIEEILTESKIKDMINYFFAKNLRSFHFIRNRLDLQW